jgi:plasmid stabilization system protein ParE
VQLVLHPDAQAEIVEAVDWYDQRAPGLGDDFLAEVDAALATVAERAHIWPTWPRADQIQPPIQRYLLSRFRFYAIAYQRFDDHVLVLAIVHARRRPFYWLKRTDE